MTVAMLDTPTGFTLVNSAGARIYVGADDVSGDISTFYPSAAWANILKQLLPEGELWDGLLAGNIGSLVEALADEFSNADLYIREAIIDFILIRTEQVLAWWETLLGLPDACDCLIAIGLTFDQRRAAVLDKLSARQTVTRAGLIIRAHKIGYEIGILECKPWRCGISSVQEPLYDDEWSHTFYVTVPEVSVTWARAGSARAGDRIRTWGNERLECWINRVKQSHTTALFSYGVS